MPAGRGPVDDGIRGFGPVCGLDGSGDADEPRDPGEESGLGEVCGCEEDRGPVEEDDGFGACCGPEGAWGFDVACGAAVPWGPDAGGGVDAAWGSDADARRVRGGGSRRCVVWTGA